MPTSIVLNLRCVRTQFLFLSMDPTLVVLAAGLGSRYGSLKQIDKFGPSGETIVDYAIYDAIQAGFSKVVFVIRQSIEDEFNEVFYPKISPRVEVKYVFQELENIPSGLAVPDNREKPWGTGHAVLMTKSEINEPFAIVNADDFYGRSALKMIYDHLSQIKNTELSGCLIGYTLKNTLSEHGRVSRGVCEIGDSDLLKSVVERTDIYTGGPTGVYYDERGNQNPLSGNETVSMNLMGFTSQVLDHIEKWFMEFYHQSSSDPKSEFYIPTVLNNVAKMNGAPISVLKTSDRWFGMTYKEDKPVAQRMLADLVKSGVYPENLWN